MTTVINNPGDGGGNGPTGLIIGILAIVILGALFFIFVLPSIRGGQAPADESTNDDINIDVTLPAGSGEQGGPEN